MVCYSLVMEHSEPQHATKPFLDAKTLYGILFQRRASVLFDGFSGKKHNLVLPRQDNSVENSPNLYSNINYPSGPHKGGGLVCRMVREGAGSLVDKIRVGGRGTGNLFRRVFSHLPHEGRKKHAHVHALSLPRSFSICTVQEKLLTVTPLVTVTQ